MFINKNIPAFGFFIAFVIFLSLTISISMSTNIEKKRTSLGISNERIKDINTLKTAIAICLQNNDGELSLCNTDKKLIPEIRFYEVNKSIIEVFVNTKILSYIKVTPSLDGDNISWKYECKGDEYIIHTNIYDKCDRVNFL